MASTANIDLMGATYPDVPAVTLPTHEGGTATFWLDGGGTDGDDLAYGGAIVGTAIVGSAVLTE